ncbi:MAG TPA: tRNA (guanosine(46)-N7)-methyltransferase TrmB [Steroidobacteraceae bacterium]|nr:tRNA (guanosine(46)-N7)-methyltransferase TrmB [Steroidobacteraceae bacterium]
MTDDPTAAPDAPRRAIRSFVRRGGRVTGAQERALAELWPRYGVAAGSEVLDLDALYGRRAPRTLEIGFGDGETLVALAAAHPERDYLGLEVHAPGVGHCLLRAAAAGLANLKLVRDDAVEVLGRCIAPGALDEVLIYFPDPWPKKRHHKRRLVQPAFVALLATRLAPGGRLRLATDWSPYAEWMREVLDAAEPFRNVAGTAGYVPRPPERPVTKFERRGARLGHAARDLEYLRR